MGNLLKVKIRWSGFTGSPGWSNLYFGDESEVFYTDANADAIADRVDTWLVGIKGLLPPAVNVTVQSDVEEIDPATGDLQRVFSAGPRNAIAGGAAANGYSAASGVVVTWRTAGVVAGRRVRGRTFLVPTATVAYDIDGSLQNSTITTLNTFSSALFPPVGGLGLAVWARPTEQHTNAKGEVVPARDGSWFPVQSHSVADKVAVLRSRRD